MVLVFREIFNWARACVRVRGIENSVTSVVGLWNGGGTESSGMFVELWLKVRALLKLQVEL